MPFERIDHTAVVVADMDEAISRWKSLTGGAITSREIVDHQDVEIAILDVGDTRLELIRPLSTDSGVGRFLTRRSESLHHVAFEVENIEAAIGALRARGIEPVDPEPRRGAHGLIVFLRPQATGGVLLELIQKFSKD
jgi:methylmalonyl-CoA epimerase